MRVVKVVSGFTLYEHEGAYYVRYEQIISKILASGLPSELLDAVLSDSEAGECQS